MNRVLHKNKFKCQNINKTLNISKKNLIFNIAASSFPSKYAVKPFIIEILVILKFDKVRRSSELIIINLDSLLEADFNLYR